VRRLECPSCRSHAISFWKWCVGLNAFRYTCESCGAGLRASTGVWAGFVITVAVALPVAIIIGLDFARLLSSDPGAWIRIATEVALASVLVFAGAVVTYSFFGYTLQRE